ncbi:MAG: hypothetical protein GXP42_08910 [Chloroflexi bacterium]|nr:hypothetical protein [Chloroflexota bacterium]
MDTTQLAQMVTWLDEQHRRDRSEIARLQQRVESQTNEIQEQARRIKALEAQLSAAQMQLTRVEQFDQSLQNLKNEVALLLEKQTEDMNRAQRELERTRMADRENFGRIIAEIRKDLERLRSVEEELAVRKSEDRRLNEGMINLRQDFTTLAKEVEDRTATLPYLIEQRKNDNKRIAQVQQENVELFKRVEEAASKLQMLEQKFQKLESVARSLPVMVDDLKRAQEQFVESLKLADADRQRQMREWAETFEQYEAEMTAQRKQYQEFLNAYEELQRAMTALERFQQGIRQEQNQMAELQRLTEERLRREMASFQEDNEKRWKKQLLEWDFRWNRQEKTNADMGEQLSEARAKLDLHSKLLQFFWREVETQGAAQLAAAQHWLDEVQKLAEQRERLFKEYEESRYPTA